MNLEPQTDPINNFVGNNQLKRTQHIEKIAFQMSDDYIQRVGPFIKNVETALNNGSITKVDAQFIHGLLDSANTLEIVDAIIEQCSSSLRVDSTLDTSSFRPVVDEALYTEQQQGQLES